MGKSRKPLTSKQLEFLRVINEPKTAQELLFAVNVHNSAPNKFLNELIKNENYLQAVMDAVIHYLRREEVKIDHEKRSQLEREFLLKQFVAQKMLQQEQQAREEIAKQQPQETIAQAIQDAIKEAYQTIAMFQAMGLLYDAQAAVNTSQWQSLASSQQDQFTKLLSDNNVKMVGSDGKDINPTSEDGQKIIANAFAAPPPSKVMSVLANAMQEAQLTQIAATSGAIPTSPPPPPALPSPKLMAKKANVNNAIRLLSELSGGETGAALLQAKKRNEQVFETLDQVFKNEKPVDVRDEINKEIKKLAELADSETGPALLKVLREQKAAAPTKQVTTESLFADAAGIHQRKTQAMADLKEARSQLVQTVEQAEKSEYKSPSPFNMRPSPFKK